jgi:hypothetical protein
MQGLGRVERTDSDVVPVRISERKLRSPSAGIYVWLFFQSANERSIVAADLNGLIITIR